MLRIVVPAQQARIFLGIIGKQVWKKIQILHCRDDFVKTEAVQLQRHAQFPHVLQACSTTNASLPWFAYNTQNGHFFALATLRNGASMQQALSQMHVQHIIAQRKQSDLQEDEEHDLRMIVLSKQAQVMKQQNQDYLLADSDAKKIDTDNDTSDDDVSSSVTSATRPAVNTLQQQDQNGKLWKEIGTWLIHYVTMQREQEEADEVYYLRSSPMDYIKKKSVKAKKQWQACGFNLLLGSFAHGMYVIE